MSKKEQVVGLKKGKLVKRTYERGREKLVPARIRPNLVQKKIAQPALAPAVAPSIPVQSPREQQVPFRTPVPAQPDYQLARTEYYPLPAQYGTTRLTLMVKDPFWLYAYWEIAQDSIESLVKGFSPEERQTAKIVLRVYDVSLIDFDGRNAHSYFDLEVGSGANNWYINLWRDNVSCIGEIGLLLPQRGFFALARSNAVHTPRCSYSLRSEQIWLEVKEEQPLRPYVQPTIIRPEKTEAVSAALAAAKKQRTYYLTEEDIRAYYTRLSPLLRDIVASGLLKLYGRDIFVLEGESRKEREVILSRLPVGYFLQKVLTGASESLLLGGSEQRLEGPAGASDFIQEKLKGHQFFFELATELIVYGRTEPDAQVWLADKQIKLRSDGTFSLRFALPDGKLPLEFKAVSQDKQSSRKITTNVERSTDYGTGLNQQRK